ncbi:hypothetical protein ACIHFE_23025 [Streptomyces sp. NPDC052396]|uniref:hypothetical protein n=1 Tax=Streptomyces sp. NPDC052396 TaxID=3365689 RepID=UPI0037D0515F
MFGLEYAVLAQPAGPVGDDLRSARRKPAGRRGRGFRIRQDHEIGRPGTDYHHLVWRRGKQGSPPTAPSMPV